MLYFYRGLLHLLLPTGHQEVKFRSKPDLKVESKPLLPLLLGHLAQPALLRDLSSHSLTSLRDLVSLLVLGDWKRQGWDQQVEILFLDDHEQNAGPSPFLLETDGSF